MALDATELLLSMEDYTLAAYPLLAYTLIRVERQALDGDRNTVLPVVRGEDFLRGRAGRHRDDAGFRPECGEIMQGTGGVRKVRVAVGGRGKSCGARVIFTSTAVSRCRS